jgi:uncharacterized protein
VPHVPARIFLRPVGTPLTIGMAGLAIASFAESGFDLGWIAPVEARNLGILMIAIPFVLQLVGCVFSYLARDGAAGAALGVLATSWLGLGLIQLAVSFGTSGALGLALIAAAAILTLSALAIATAKPLPALVFVLAAVRFALIGTYHLSGNGSLQDAAGVAGLVVAAGAAYCVGAFELEGQLHRTVLPTFRRAQGREAVSAEAARPLEGVAQEAGVRRTT